MAEEKIKAYKVWTDDSELGCMVIFAGSSGKAKAAGVNEINDFFEGAGFTDMHAVRLPACDALYKGKTIGSWDDMGLRKVLVDQYGWYCQYPEYEDCTACGLQCRHMEEMQETERITKRIKGK